MQAYLRKGSCTTLCHNNRTYSDNLLFVSSYKPYYSYKEISEQCKTK